ncbi:MAG: hypothetical protein CVU85_08780, partial [Firmicutes bacterium HGW-Firmicutes-10]
MTKKLMRMVLAVALVFGSLLFFSMRDILAAPSAITGVVDGEYYNTSVTIEFDDVTYDVTLEGELIGSPTIVATDGSYTLVVSDGVDDIETISFWIDTVLPEVTGVIDGSYYKNSVTVEFTDASLVSATLNGDPFTSGTTITEDNEYILIVTDLANNKTTITFTIDTIAPEVIGIIDGAYYKTSVSAVFSDTSPVSATLNGDVYVPGTSISEDDEYELIVTDLAGNTTTITFTIDTIAPVVTGVTDGSYYNDPPKIATFTEGTA